MKSIAFSCLVISFITAAWAATNWDKVIFKIFDYPLHKSVNKPKIDNEKIVGGSEVDPHSRPFQVALIMTLEDGNMTVCGGSLISTTFVLTAAHCLHRPDLRNIEVILGAHDIREFELTQVRMNTMEFILHSKYNPQNKRNDIALLKLPETVTLNDYISLVSLPSRADVKNKFIGYNATVSGWGRITDEMPNVNSPVLLFMTNLVISPKQCYKIFNTMITSSNLCISGEGERSACSGDSGGPVTIHKKSREILIGLVSFGIKWCSLGYPQVNTRITSFLRWIQNNAGIIIK